MENRQREAIGPESKYRHNPLADLGSLDIRRLSRPEILIWLEPREILARTLESNKKLYRIAVSGPSLDQQHHCRVLEDCVTAGRHICQFPTAPLQLHSLPPHIGLCQSGLIVRLRIRHVYSSYMHRCLQHSPSNPVNSDLQLGNSFQIACQESGWDLGQNFGGVRCFREEPALALECQESAWLGKKKKKKKNVGKRLV